VSGDNSRKTYDEPADMKRALVRLGVPEDRIVCDYAGFSTLDSVVRAREVFLEEALIVVSQEFHVRRAIYIGKARGVDLIGFAARDVPRRHGIQTELRESLARFKAVLDVSLLGRRPRFLGEPIEIGARVGGPAGGDGASRPPFILHLYPAVKIRNVLYTSRM